jgi:serine/threonine-protein kinase RsbW
MMTYLPPLEVSNDRKPSFSKSKSFPGRYESLASIGDFVRKIAQEAGFESFAVYSIEMAVDEACSNIIEHAYGGEGKGSIHCTCSVTEDAIQVEIKDQGKPFDPSSIPPPNLSQNLEERQAHGLGLHFIRKWMDEVQFLSEGKENTLTMVKHK